MKPTKEYAIRFSWTPYALFFFRADFIQEARILTCLNHPNLVSVVGVCISDGDPLYMICEYGDKGDLCQFLQDHVAETSLSKSSGVPTLRYAL